MTRIVSETNRKIPTVSCLAMVRVIVKGQVDHCH